MIKIYILKDPITGDIKYVGKTYRDENIRLSEHIHDSKRKKGYKENWIRKLTKKGYKPIIEIIDLVKEDEWQYWEKFYINKFKNEKNIKLVNIELGGNGSDRISEELRKKLQKKSKTKKSVCVNNMQGEFCANFNSISECVREFFSIDKNINPKEYKRTHSVISRICAGKNKSYLGYVFFNFIGVVDKSKNKMFDKVYSNSFKKRKRELNKEEADEIRNLYNLGIYTQKDLAEKFKTSVTTINFILKNISFINKNYKADIVNIKTQKGEKNNASKYTSELVKEIKEMIKEGKGVTEIAKKFNMPVSTVGNIKYNTQWKHI